MAEPAAPDRSKGTAGRRWLWVIAGVAASLLALAVTAPVWLGSPPGLAWLARQIEAGERASGLTIKLGRIEGRLLSNLRISSITLGDARGRFARLENIAIRWSPRALTAGTLRLHTLDIAEARLDRLPELAPDDAPGLLDRFDLALDRLQIDTLVLGAPMAGGVERRVRLTGSAARRTGRLLLDIDAAELDGSDRLALRLDYEQDKRKLELAGTATGAAGGTLAGLAGIEGPLTASLDGRGTLDDWSGDFSLTIAGQQAARLAARLTAAKAQLSGMLLPSGAVEDVLGPRVPIALTATRQTDRWQVDGSADAQALRLAVGGAISADGETLHRLRLTLSPRGPVGSVTLDDAALVAEADGRLDALNVRAGLVARQLRLDDQAINAVRLGLVGSVANGRLTGQLACSLAPAVGDAQTRALMGPVRLNGSIAADARALTLAGDGLRISLPAWTGRARGSYRYDDGVAALTLAGTTGPGLDEALAGIRLATTAELGWRAGVLQGPVRIVRLSRSGDGLHDLAGGQAVITTTLRLANGTTRLDPLALAAGAVRLAGSAQLSPDGAAAIRLDGTIPPAVLTRLGLADVSGPASVQLRVDGPLESPGAMASARLGAATAGGIAMRAMTLEASGSDLQTWSLDLRAQALGGPLRATADLDLSPQLALSNIDLRAAGLKLEGDLAASAGDQWSGRLRAGLDPASRQASGQLSGALTLTPDAAGQRLALNATARSLAIAGDVPFTIGALDVSGNGVIGRSRDAFSITGSANAIAWARWRVERASLDGRWADDALSARWAVTGRRNSPFALSGSVSAARDARRAWAIRSTIDGTLADQPVGTSAPLTARIGLGGWTLDPVNLRFGASALVLAGSGRQGRSVVTADLKETPLSIADLFMPRLDLDGTANGRIALTLAGGRPIAGDMSLVIRNARRASLALAAIPVDAALTARLANGQLTARTRLMLRGRPSGLMSLAAGPLRADLPFVQALLAAPARGRLVWNGPAEAVWGFTALDGHDLRGPLKVDARIGGTLGDPDLTGSVRLAGGRYEALAIGLRARNVQLGARFDGPRMTIEQLTAETAGGGALSGTGWAELSAASGFPAELSFALENAAVLGRDDLEAEATGSVFISHGPAGGRIDGKMTVTEGRVRVGPTETQIAELAVIERNRDSLPEAARPALVPPIKPWRLNLDLTINRRFAVEGMGLSSFWSGRLRLRGTTAVPNVVGQLAIDRGDYDFAGRRFTIDRGALAFTGGAGINPTIDILATHRLADVTGRIEVTGQARRPIIAFKSEPALPQDEVIARLLFGDSIANLSALEALQLADAVETLRTGGRGSINVLSRFRSAVGIDRLRLDDKAAIDGAEGPTITGGKYLTERVYVEITTDGQGYTASQLEVDLTRTLSILSRIATLGGTNVLLRWSKDY